MRAPSLLIAGLLAAAPAAWAGTVEIVDAKAELRRDGTYRFTVTLLHADEGWHHYADSWEVLAPDGRVLGTRVLRHPHEDEQPFTRGLAGIEIPKTISAVRIRAHDTVHGYAPRTVEVLLPGR